MVRENRGEKEQDSVTTTEAVGCEQKPGRRERRVAQSENGKGRLTRHRRSETDTW